MPSLGGLLKKRRTKDSQTLSKELEAGSAQTQTSPNAAEDDHNHNHNHHHHHNPLHYLTHHHHNNPDHHQQQNQQQNQQEHQQPASNSATTADPANQPQNSAANQLNRSSTADQSNEGQPVSMQSTVSQASPSQHTSGVSQSNVNAASIQNIIHSSQQGSTHSGSGSQAQGQSANRNDARTTKGKYSLDDFILQRTLGTGSFGRVHLVQSKHNHRFYAIKVLKKAQVVKMKQIEHTNDERRMLNRVRHPFLITLWGTWQDSRNLYMVMDFVEGGELFSLLRKSQRFPNPVAKFYAAEVTLALEYLHSQQIIYRDLKPENLLLDRHGHLKITDFGFAKEVPDITWTLCGTPDYLAPEVVSSKGYNKSVDWWSLGILIFEMLCGFTPFWDSGSPVKIYENILRGRVKYPPYLHPDAVDLLSQLITADLTKRLGNLHGGSEDVKNHPWFAEVTWDRLARKDIDAPYVPPIRGGQGDASQYDRYPEETEQYGMGGEDPHGHLFPDF
ncbi:cAMP-dependent protein kinase catalytic subunit pkaC [Aspergillus fijiensis CBS 313.89]|uniref:cAMP-dependent protein kinase n=1 Tax=Aspergillus fijiensis CBS 313.89 TaxID=1448319 RepID=A0A8G1VWS7_9EURO|nr:camp-dependent protein kinase type 2 [Aspergillus fijiensis CBS 313.89]RAK74583.1 camp-dependent protein kinase type 2 [Aspergillus fijiensis CBS 313.89]